LGAYLNTRTSDTLILQFFQFILAVRPLDPAAVFGARSERHRVIFKVAIQLRVFNAPRVFLEHNIPYIRKNHGLIFFAGSLKIFGVKMHPVSIYWPFVPGGMLPLKDFIITIIAGV